MIPLGESVGLVNETKSRVESELEVKAYIQNQLKQDKENKVILRCLIKSKKTSFLFFGRLLMTSTSLMFFSFLFIIYPTSWLIVTPYHVLSLA